jgi:hypothetical protein
MKAEWTDETDEKICLCCGQPTPQRLNVMSSIELAWRLAILEALGFTREELLTKHREQIDWQMPGLATWLESQRKEEQEQWLESQRKEGDDGGAT